MRRDPAVQGRIERQEDDAVAAAAQLALDQELAERPRRVVGLRAGRAIGRGVVPGLREHLAAALPPRAGGPRWARPVRPVRPARAFPVACRQPQGQHLVPVGVDGESSGCIGFRQFLLQPLDGAEPEHPGGVGRPAQDLPDRLEAKSFPAAQLDHTTVILGQLSQGIPQGVGLFSTDRPRRGREIRVSQSERMFLLDRDFPLDASFRLALEPADVADVIPQDLAQPEP